MPKVVEIESVDAARRRHGVHVTHVLGEQLGDIRAGQIVGNDLVIAHSYQHSRREITSAPLLSPPDQNFFESDLLRVTKTDSTGHDFDAEKQRRQKNSPG